MSSRGADWLALRTSQSLWDIGSLRECPGQAGAGALDLTYTEATHSRGLRGGTAAPPAPGVHTPLLEFHSRPPLSPHPKRMFFSVESRYSQHMHPDLIPSKVHLYSYISKMCSVMSHLENVRKGHTGSHRMDILVVKDFSKCVSSSIF